MASASGANAVGADAVVVPTMRLATQAPVPVGVGLPAVVQRADAVAEELGGQPVARDPVVDEVRHVVVQWV